MVALDWHTASGIHGGANIDTHLAADCHKHPDCYLDAVTITHYDASGDLDADAGECQVLSSRPERREHRMG
jgi:hypothetical protein